MLRALTGDSTYVWFNHNNEHSNISRDLENLISALGTFGGCYDFSSMISVFGETVVTWTYISYQNKKIKGSCILYSLLCLGLVSNFNQNCFSYFNFFFQTIKYYDEGSLLSHQMSRD